MDYETYSALSFDRTWLAMKVIRERNQALSNDAVEVLLSRILELAQTSIDGDTRLFVEQYLSQIAQLRPDNDRDIFPDVEKIFCNSWIDEVQSRIEKNAMFPGPVIKYAIAAVVAETLTSARVHNPKFTKYVPTLQNDVASYLAIKWGDTFSRAFTLDFEAFKAEAEGVQRALAVENQSAINETRAATISLQELKVQHQATITDLKRDAEKITQSNDQSVKEMALQIDSAVAKVIDAESRASKFDKKLEGNEKNFESFRTALEKRYQIDVTRQLWRTRGNWSTIAFVISSAVLLCMLIVLPGLALWFHDTVLTAYAAIVGRISALPENPTDSQVAVAALNRLVLVIFPGALYIWAVKLVVRFNLRSLALADDARLRQTMMDTFYRINVDQGATAEERHLMLNALYRPQAGQPPDPVDFPNVIELIKRP